MDVKTDREEAGGIRKWATLAEGKKVTEMVVGKRLRFH